MNSKILTSWFYSTSNRTLVDPDYSVNDVPGRSNYRDRVAHMVIWVVGC